MNGHVSEVVTWLFKHGYPPIPVAPVQDARRYHKVIRSADGVESCPFAKGTTEPTPLFTGKNPSYLDKAGTPHLLNHGAYQDKLPTTKELNLWFANPENGVGTLGGWNQTFWIDFDSKHYDSPEDLDAYFSGLLGQADLANSWVEQTHSGGYRLAVKLESEPGFTNFATEQDGPHRGEVLGVGRFTVLAPTVGPSGNEYRNINRVEPIALSSLEAIAIYPYSTRKTNTSTVTRLRAVSSGLGIDLEQLGTEASRRVLAGDNGGDRSAALAMAIREWYGWENWASTNGIPCRGTAETLAHDAGSALGLDESRVNRILKTVDPADCKPSCLHHSEESPWKKIRRLDRATFEERAPETVKRALQAIAAPSEIVRSIPEPKTVELQEAPEQATPEERLRHAIANLNKVHDSGNPFQYIPLKNKICDDWRLKPGQIDILCRDLRKAQLGQGAIASAADVVTTAFDEIEQRANGGKLPGVTCGFYEIDAMTQGYQRTDLIIKAARPGMGKTSQMLAEARSIAAFHRLPVVIFSLEMSKEQLIYRLLSAESSIEMGRLRAGRINPDEWETLSNAVETLSMLPIYIDDTPHITVSEMESKLRRLQSETGQAIAFVGLDYIQLMAGEGENRVAALTNISRSLKGLARDFNVPVMALSQLSRGVESRDNKRPMSSDLRDCGALEQDADLIMMLYREEVYKPDTSDRGIAEVIFTKHRNGPLGTVKLLFDAPFARFRNLTSQLNRRSA